MVNIDVDSENTGSSNTTVSNIGLGFGWYKQIINSNIQFKTLIAGSTKLGVTNNTNDLTLDISEASLTLSNIGGALLDSQISPSTLTTTNTKSMSNKTIDVQGPNYIKNVTEYMYIVWFDGSDYNALNTHTGNLDSVNTDAWTVLNYAINTGANGNGAIFIKKGFYPLSQTLKPVSNSHIVGEGWQQTQLRATGNYPALTLDVNVINCEVDEIFFTTAFTGYTSNVVQFNNKANNNMFNRCIWYDFGVATGNAIGFVNTAAANSGTGITLNSFANCQVTGFTNAIYMQVVNASTTLPIDINGNWINGNNFYNLYVNAPTKRVLYMDGASGSAMLTNNFFNCNFEATSCPDCAFYYDDNSGAAIIPEHKYTTHSGVIVWDLPTGKNYANVNSNTYITFTGCLSDWLIGGSATTAQKNANLQHISANPEMNNTDNFTQTLNNKALNATSITNTGLTTLEPTAAGGFESVLVGTVGSSTDTFRIDNGYNTSGVFAPIIRATLQSANALSTQTPLYFQGIITPANDVGNTPCVVFGGMRTGQGLLTSRPICEFQNQFNSAYTFYPTYLDFHNNSIKNSIILDTNGNQIGVHQRYDYLVYYDGAKFVARNGTTGAVDYSNTTDGAAVLNSAMSALTSGGVVAYKGTILCRSTVVMQSLIYLKGIGEGASIKQDASQNLAVLVDSANFATLTGTNSTAGVYSVYMENVMIDGNKANNTTTATIGLRYFGYNWHVKGLHIINCHGIGHYSEWGVSPSSPATGTAMNSTYNDIAINLCDGIGWQMRGPHDSMMNNVLVYQCGGVGISVEFSTNVYDGSSEWSNVHIFSCVGIGMDAKGGTVRFRGLTTESITTSGIGLLQEGAIVQGTHFESYNNTTGLKLTSGGISMFSGSSIHDNTTDGIEIQKNDVVISGHVYNNATKGIVLGTSGISLADIVLACDISGHTTANIDWANPNNQGITGTCVLYNDSTHQTPVLTPNNIDYTRNSLLLETIANGTATKFNDSRALSTKMAYKSPFYRKSGQMFVAHGTIVKEGLFNGIVESGTASYNNTDQWLGMYATYATGTTQNSKAGLNGGTGTQAIFTRTSNPSFRTHIKVPTITTSRYYGGFSSATALPVTDAPLGNTDSGIIVGWNSSDTTIKIYNNDGTGAAPTAVDSGITIPTGLWTFEILSDDANGRFTVNIVSGTNTFSVNITTRIPASATRLAVYSCLENTSTASLTLQMDVSYLESNFIQ